MLRTSLLPLAQAVFFMSPLDDASEPPDRTTARMFRADGLDAVEKTETKTFTTSSHTDPGWNEDGVIADFDHNGIIDLWDFMGFVDVYGLDDR